MAAQLIIRPGHPDLLELPWDRSIVEWEVDNLLDLPKDISRHEVRFLSYDQGVYVVKELPTAAAHNEYRTLRTLEARRAPAVKSVGLVESRVDDAGHEASAALITEYEQFSFSYRQLLAGAGFGPRRNQMLDAFAGLLVELHVAGCFWGDCSLSNVLYRFDAAGIVTLLVDAETAQVVAAGTLSEGHRREDLAIMIENVGGGMADIAAEAGASLDEADLELGEDIAARYNGLWDELTKIETVGAEESFRVRDRIDRLNKLGFDVDEVDLVPNLEDTAELRIKVKVVGRNYHSDRLRALTGVDALEGQARQILSDLYYAAAQPAQSSTGKDLAAIRWRVGVFEPMLAKLKSTEGVVDPIQAYCDLLHHRYLLSVEHGRDIGNDEAYESWLAAGRPGYPLEEAPV
jgi:hypothetical protein